jgi:hypothetical protein
VRFFDDLIKDKVVMINIIYTSCPDVCPLETARLREVQKNLGDRVGKDVFMYSITVDPQRDTPEVLRKYAEKFDAGPGGLFLIEKKAEKSAKRQIGPDLLGVTGKRVRAWRTKNKAGPLRARPFLSDRKTAANSIIREPPAGRPAAPVPLP